MAEANEILLTESHLNNSRYIEEVQSHQASRMNESFMTTDSEAEHYAAFSHNMTKAGMIQSTIYHIRHEGQNVHDPFEKNKYYSSEFLNH